MTIGVLAVPVVLLGKSFFAIALALVALAGALSETDDQPRGRIKSLTLKVLSFALSSLLVERLSPYPVLLGFGLFVSTIAFVLIGSRCFCLPARCYGLFSFLFLCRHPWRALDEHLARGFVALSK